jgi:hypothetical protein
MARLWHGFQYFSDFAEAYAEPGDGRAKGASFLGEAKRLLEEDKRVHLSTLQGLLLFYEEYSKRVDQFLFLYTDIIIYVNILSFYFQVYYERKTELKKHHP